MSPRGYTLMEVMVTVAILGILAATALPHFTKTRERGFWNGTQDILLTIYAGEQTFGAVNRNAANQSVYRTGLDNTSGAAAWAEIYTDDPNTLAMPIDYFVVDSSSAKNNTKFRAYANRQGGGLCAGINQNRLLCPGNPPDPACPPAPADAPCTAWWTRP